MRRQQKSHGFTIVEAIISIAISSIVIVYAGKWFQSMYRAQESYRLRAAAHTQNMLTSKDMESEFTITAYSAPTSQAIVSTEEVVFQTVHYADGGNIPLDSSYKNVCATVPMDLRDRWTTIDKSKMPSDLGCLSQCPANETRAILVTKEDDAGGSKTYCLPTTFQYVNNRCMYSAEQRYASAGMSFCMEVLSGLFFKRAVLSIETYYIDNGKIEVEREQVGLDKDRSGSNNIEYVKYEED